jgi:hypothetical protein
VFEKRAMRRIFGPKREEVTQGKRKLYSEEHNKFNSSPKIIGMIKPKRMGWTRHVARIGNVWSEY